MLKLKYLVLLFLALMQTFVFSEENTNIALGEQLEKQMWDAIKDKNWSFIERHIALDFQSIHDDGARNRTQEMALIKSLNLGDFIFSDIKVTEGYDTIVITYNVSVYETIDAVRIAGDKAPRLTVWRNVYGNWQWLAHANPTSLEVKRINIK